MAQQLSSVNVALNASTAQYVQSLKKAQDQTNRHLDGMESSYKKLSKSVGKYANVIGVSLAAIGSVSGVASIIAETGELEREIEKLASASGLGAQEFKEYAFAAKSVGINLDQIGSIFGDTEEKIADFIATGGGGFQDFADVMKLTKDEAENAAIAFKDMSSPEVLQAMVNQMEAAGKSAGDMNFALEGMASEARYLRPLLVDNGAEINRVKKVFSDTATVISDDAVIAMNSAASSTELMTKNFNNWISNAATPAIGAWDDLTLSVAKYFKSIDKRNSRKEDESIAEQFLSDDDVKAFDEKIAKVQGNIIATSKSFAGINYDVTLDPVDQAYNETLAKQIALLKEQKAALLDTKVEKAKLAGTSTPTEAEASLSSGISIEDIMAENELIAKEVKAIEDEANAKKREKFLADEAEFNQAKAELRATALYNEQELELFNAETAQERLDLQRELELENLDNSTSEKLQKTEEYEAAKKAIEEKYRQQKSALDQLSAEAEFNAKVQGIDKAGEALGVQFNLEKNLALSKALINAPLAISEAVASAPFPYNLPAIGFASLEAVATIAEIKSVNFGQYHAGTDSVPMSGDNQSFLLSAGERVVQPQANEDLTEYLKMQKQDGYSGGGSTSISAPVNITGNVTDEKWFNAQLVKQRDTIYAATKKVERERPRQR